MKDKYKKSKEMVVTFDEESDGFLWFTVSSPSKFTYRVSYHKKSGHFRCECLSYIYTPELLCSHMIAVKDYAGKLIKEVVQV